MSDEAKPKRKWVQILIGVGLFVAVIGIGTVVFTVSWLRENLRVIQTTEEDATSSFDEVLAKFPGQAPLLEFSDGKPRLVAERATRQPSTPKLRTLHILAFDLDGGELARFQLPFWLLRMKSGPIAFSSYASGFDDGGVNLKVEDLEKHGPGIVIDLTRPGEGRVLIWAE